MPAGDEVDSIIILPPSGARSEAHLRGVEAFLKSCFPEYGFLPRATFLRFEGDYQVLPIWDVH
ncbi:hypothetical protein NKH16_19225 [Mesorhizobium sp. M1307]|uniref:hypothetical protein n=1 Tax=Mesorhizobium sp. M1307 TaxID=2957079 RepID=UPI00333D5A9B